MKQEMSYAELMEAYRENADENDSVQALMMLPPDKRNLFILHVQYGNVAKLARHLNVSPNTLRNMLERIKQMILRNLNKIQNQ